MRGANLATTITMGALLLAWIPAESAADVRGRVFDEFGSLSGANVWLSGFAGTHTDACGRFELPLPELSGLSSVSGRLRVAAPFHEPMSVVVNLDGAEPVIVRMRSSASSRRPELLGAPCDTLFLADLHQGDRALPRGMVLLDDSAHDTSSASRTSRAGRLVLLRGGPSCTLRVRWSACTEGAPLAVFESASERIVHVLASRTTRSGEICWTGDLTDGASLPPGRYRLRLGPPTDSLALDFSRWVRPAPASSRDSYDWPSCP